MKHLKRRGIFSLLVLAPALVLAAAPGRASAPPPVDETRLVPSLSAAFGPWTCRTRQTGPVCTGERHVSSDWEPFDLPCGDTQLWARTESHRYQTRYYTTDYLDSFREFRTRDADYLGTSPRGPATATISTNVRFEEPFAVPGDDRTRTIVTQGVLWDIRPVHGPAVWRAVGTLVEQPDAEGRFSGHVTDASGTTKYEDAPLSEVLDDDTFVGAVCAAATGAG